jgi:hypothetical protein
MDFRRGLADVLPQSFLQGLRKLCDKPYSIAGESEENGTRHLTNKEPKTILPQQCVVYITL